MENTETGWVKMVLLDEDGLVRHECEAGWQYPADVVLDNDGRIERVIRRGSPLYEVPEGSTLDAMQHEMDIYPEDYPESVENDMDLIYVGRYPESPSGRQIRVKA